MCNFYLMYYTDPSAGTSFYPCVDNMAPELVDHIPLDSDVTLPPNPSLDDLAEGNNYEGKRVDSVVDTLSFSNRSVSRSGDYAVDDSYPSRDSPARPSYDRSLHENTYRGRWQSNLHGQGNQYRQQNRGVQGNQYGRWNQRNSHAQDNHYAQQKLDESDKEEEEEQEVMEQRNRNQHPYPDPVEDENPIVASHQDASSSSSISTDRSPTSASVPSTIVPSAGTSTRLIGSIVESVVRSSMSSKLDVSVNCMEPFRMFHLDLEVFRIVPLRS